MGQRQQSPQVGRDGHMGPVKECRGLGVPPQLSPPVPSSLSFRALSVHGRAPSAHHKVGMRIKGGHKCNDATAAGPPTPAPFCTHLSVPASRPQATGSEAQRSRHNVKWGKIGT